MYQIKFLKPLTISRNPSIPAKHNIRANDPIYELSTTITVTNDLGEQFFYGDTAVTLQTRSYPKNTLPLAQKPFTVVSESEERWSPGKRAVDVRIPLSMRSAPSDSFISLFAFVNPRTQSNDMMAGDAVSTEEMVHDTLEGLDQSLFDSCGDSTTVKTDGVHFLPTLTDLLEVPKSLTQLPVKTDRVAVRSINDVLLYEELSGSIARHLWDAGVLVNGLGRDELLSFICFGHRAMKISGKLNILELGTGIGLVSIHLGKLLTNATVLATDLEDAEEICTKNINLNSVGRSVRFSELDWETPTKQSTAWDVIVITDCTYNPLYYDALITVLRREAGRGTAVVLAHKFREPFSESEFFTKIGAHFELRKQQWHGTDQTLIHLGLYAIK